MKFTAITETKYEKGQLEQDYASARKIGRYEMGKLAVYCPKMFKRVYISINDIVWAYRRQEAVEGKLCCGKATFEIHKIILVTEKRQRFELAGMGLDQAKEILEVLAQENSGIDIGYSKEKEANYFNSPA